jgi:hypothetical protein
LTCMSSRSMSAHVSATNSDLRRPVLPASITIARSRRLRTAMSAANSAGESTSGSRSRLAETPHLCDWVPVHPFMADGVIEYRRHDVANLAPRARGILESMQPQFHIHSANIRQIERTPLGDDVILSGSAYSLRRWHRLSCPPSVRGYGSGLQAQRPSGTMNSALMVLRSASAVFSASQRCG